MDWYSDIKLDDGWQLTQATNGDAPLITDTDAFLQDIKLESMTQEGELFYDRSYGWSLLDFLHSPDDETTSLEVGERVRSKLAEREEIDVESISVETDFIGDYLSIRATFRLAGSAEAQQVQVSLDRVNIEVIVSD